MREEYVRFPKCHAEAAVFHRFSSVFLSRSEPSAYHVEVSGFRSKVFSSKPVKKISDPDKLLAYAAWYYGRYAPPLAKLKARLELKASVPELAFEAFATFSKYASDRANLESKASFAARS